MYCRNCGEAIAESSTKCLMCNTINGEGVDYCCNCGGYTTEKTEFCKKCGMKLKTIVPRNLREERVNETQKKVDKYKKIQDILKALIGVSVFIVVVLVCVFVLGEQPDDIPEPPAYSDLSPNASVHDGFIKVGNTYYYESEISSDVAEYWVKNREILDCIVVLAFFCVGTFVDLLIIKNKYKKLIKELEEGKNVL